MVDRDFVEKRTTEITLRDGTRVRLRPIVPADKDRIRYGFDRLSSESRYRRFMTPLDELSPEMLQSFTEIDYVDHFAWAALALDEPGEPGIGVARYVRVPGEPEVAEAAVTVIDEYQNRGLGTILLQVLGAVALEHGIRRFRGYAVEDNRAIRELAHGAAVHHEAPGVMRIEVDLPGQQEELLGSPLYAALRAVARGEASAIPPPSERG